MHICPDSSESLSHVVMKLCPSAVFQLIRVRERERKRERDCMELAQKSFVLALFLRISKHNVWVNQSILLQLLPRRTNARRGSNSATLTSFFLSFFKVRENQNIT